MTSYDLCKGPKIRPLGEERRLSFLDFLDLILSLRGTNIATMKAGPTPQTLKRCGLSAGWPKHTKLLGFRWPWDWLQDSG